jgi:DNA repair protein RadC
MVTANKTAQVVLAHNHLNDDPQPSMNDMQLTRRLAITFQNLGIKFLDHIIIAGDNDYSFHLSGLLDTLKSNMPDK